MVDSRSLPKREKLLIYCEYCSEDKPFFYVSTDRNFANVCPKCHNYLTRRMCTRCFHSWTPRTTHLSKVCPVCKSPYWCRQRGNRRK